MPQPSFPVAVIGGTGLYQIDGLAQVQEHRIATPHGPTSDAIVTGLLHGAPVAFLARHGRGHHLTPSEIPFLANLWALRSLGVRYLISLSAVGSLRPDVQPLDALVPDQFIDLTRQRERTFFGRGVVAHAALADPVCPALRQVLLEAGRRTGFGRGRVHDGGTYVCIEGPQFSTRAESALYRQWGASVVGMTNLPEARLAREAEIAYATVALVTDYDCWKDDEPPVTAASVMATLAENTANARRLVVEAVARLHAAPPPSVAHEALKAALITPLERIPPDRAAQLQPILAPYLRQ
jgi:5'-methylthioadenosine phosphorylase